MEERNHLLYCYLCIHLCHLYVLKKKDFRITVGTAETADTDREERMQISNIHFRIYCKFWFRESECLVEPEEGEKREF